MKRIGGLKTLFLGALLAASSAQAWPGSKLQQRPELNIQQPPNPPATQSPVDETCLNHGKPLDIINDEVLKWKTSTANSFLARARIQGTVDEVFPDHSGHRHFSLKIGPQNTDHIEVIYNLSFGHLPTPSIGVTAEACGDYITSIAQTGPYPASPDGAIIHWVHRSPSGHEPGYVILNGIKY